MEGSATTQEARPGPDGETLPPGSLVGRYVVLNRLGAGGAGIVYSAFDPDLDRKVALKLLLPGRDADPAAAALRKERLIQEAKSIAAISHPNVVAIFDVGTHAGKVFIAMEFLAGGTLREWLAPATRSVPEIVVVFAELARGLTAAHARGVIHRDFKPDNVLFDHDGRPKVADFGLARADRDRESSAEAWLAGDVSEARLTRTGAVVGTPAYMSPEQLLGQPLDARTDQFSFCVTLYEAVHGRRPFAGDDLVTLAAAVTAGRLGPEKGRAPGWLQRLLLRGLAPAPADRFPSMAALGVELAGEPRTKWRRRARASGLAGAVLVALVLAGTLGYRRWRFEAALGAQLGEGRAALASAERSRAALEATKAKAFGLFDAHRSEDAELTWSAALKLARDVDRDHARASERIESAFLLDPSRAVSRALLADVLYERADFDELHRDHVDVELVQRLALYDEGGMRRQRLQAPAHLRVELPADLANARARLESFSPATGLYQPLVAAFAGTVLERQLAPGSYRLTLEASGRLTVHLPVFLRRGETLKLRPRLPSVASAPPDFVYVPEADFLTGSAADEAYRRDLQHASPLHRVAGKAFFIKRTETTYGEWIEYLEALEPAERATRTPRAASLGIQGDVELRRNAGGWELRLQPASDAYVARQTAPLRYPHRDVRRDQDWLRLPVSGVSWRDAVAYTAWLARTKRVPGARLCQDAEWERAARGADGRPFPHGWHLEPGDANYRETWKTDPKRYGPDTVGSYPKSRSPFGVDDLAGNVFEWVAMPAADEATTAGARGGAFPFDPNALRTELRELVEPALRDITAGVRVCADAAAP
jgi:formylglycine-generating enzyme required for sulfatase activity